MENTNIENKETLEDAMVFDTKEDLDKKKKDWDSIFLTCPDLSDRILAIQSDLGEEGLKLLNEFIVDGFSDYYKSSKGDNTDSE